MELLRLSSAKPTSDTYRGPSAWYAPEARRWRNFVNSRVINGRQQLTVSLSLHSAGRLVLWSYSYTKQDVPPGMPQDDHAAFVALGRQLGSLNGYRAKHGSDLYIIDGDHDDWTYNKHGIFAFSFEMARGATNRYYPTPQELAVDIRQQQASCPASGRTGRLPIPRCWARSRALLRTIERGAMTTKRHLSAATVLLATMTQRTLVNEEARAHCLGG